MFWSIQDILVVSALSNDSAKIGNPETAAAVAAVVENANRAHGEERYGIARSNPCLAFFLTCRLNCLLHVRELWVPIELCGLHERGFSLNIGRIRAPSNA